MVKSFSYTGRSDVSSVIFIFEYIFWPFTTNMFHWYDYLIIVREQIRKIYYDGIPFSEAKIVVIILIDTSFKHNLKFKIQMLVGNEMTWFHVSNRFRRIIQGMHYILTYLYYYKDFHPTLISIRARIMNWTGQSIIIPRYSEFWG